jgi:hypothetical protein
VALSPDRRVAVLLAETTAVQMLGAMAVLTIPAIAPKVADALSTPASFMGGQISLVYLAAMGASLAAGKAHRRARRVADEPGRDAAHSGGQRAGEPRRSGRSRPGSLVIGAAYGLLNPAASDLLVRHALAGQRSLIFAIK